MKNHVSFRTDKKESLKKLHLGFINYIMMNQFPFFLTKDSSYYLKVNKASLDKINN